MQLPGAVKVTLGFPRGKPRTLDITIDTTVTDYSPGVNGPRIDYFRLTDPKYVGKYAIASKDALGNVIAFSMSPNVHKPPVRADPSATSRVSGK